MISRIEAFNYRCFDRLDIKLGRYHVLAGANGTGKSTLLDISLLWGEILSQGLVPAFLESPSIGGSPRAQNLRELLHYGRGNYFGFAIEADLPEEIIIKLLEDAPPTVLNLSYLWTGSLNGVQLQIWGTWLFYAILVDLGDAVADELEMPFEQISLKMIDRGMYHFSVAYEKGLFTDPIKYFTDPQNQDLGIVKRGRKPNVRLIVSPFPATQRSPEEFFSNPPFINNPDFNFLLTQIRVFLLIDKSAFSLTCDQWPSHKVASIEPLIQSMDASVLNMSPYSPDFNLIELWWLQLKAFLRQFSPTTTKKVDILIATVLDLINPKHLKNWFTDCCYCTS